LLFVFCAGNVGVSYGLTEPEVLPWDWYGDNGQQTWADNYPDCAASWQAPIDVPYETIKTCVDPIQWTNLEWPQQIVLRNDFRLGVIYLTDSAYPVTASGGPLPADVPKYYVRTLAFSVGCNSTGSDHAIQGYKYAMEVKITLTSNDLSSPIDEQGNSVVVISFVIAQCKKDNPAWASIIGALKDVQRAGTEHKLSIPSLGSLLPTYRDWGHQFFWYIGSSTQPPCQRNIIRIVYKNPIYFSVPQVEEWRHIVNEVYAPLVDNYRYLQPLQWRQVWRSFA